MNKTIVLYYLFLFLFIVERIYSAAVGTAGVNPTNPSLIAPSNPFTGGYAIKFPPNGVYEGTIQNINIGSAFTIDFWIRFTKTTNGGVFNFQDATSNADIQFAIAGGKLTAKLINDAATQTFTIQAPVAIVQNSWYHVALTAARDQNKACIIYAQYGASFRDDVLQSIHCENNVQVPQGRTWSSFVLGTDGTAAARFEGFIDDLRFWSRFFDEASVDGLEGVVDASDATVKHWYNFNDNSFAFGARDVASGSKHMAFNAQTSPFFVHPQFEDPTPLPVSEACGGWGDIHLTSPVIGNQENQGVAGIQLVYAPANQTGEILGVEVRLVFCSGTITCGTGMGWRALGETFVYDGRGYEPWSNGLRRGLRIRDAANKLRKYPGCKIGNDNPEQHCVPSWGAKAITTGVGSSVWLTSSSNRVTMNARVPGKFEIVFTDHYPWGSSGYANYNLYLPTSIDRNKIEGICGPARFKSANYNYFDIVKDDPPIPEIPPPIDEPPTDVIPPVDPELVYCATLLCNDTSLVALPYKDDCWMEIALAHDVVAGVSAAEQTYLECLRKQNERKANEPFVECPKPCPNFCGGPCQGTCVEGECVCKDGWIGKDCSFDEDSVCVEATIDDGTKTPITTFVTEQSINSFYNYRDRASRSNIAQSNGLVVAIHKQVPLSGDKEIVDKLAPGSAPKTSLVLLADKPNDQFGGELDITVTFDNGAGANINPVAIAVKDDGTTDTSSDPADTFTFDGRTGNLKFKWIPQTTDGVAFTDLPEKDWCAKVTINKAVSVNRVYLADGASATQCGPHVSLLGCVQTSGAGQVERQSPTCNLVKTFTVCTTSCHDECIAITDCTECRAKDNCGWCASSGTCLSGTASGPNAAQCEAWRWDIDDSTSRVIATHENAFSPVRTEFIQAFLAPNDPLETFVQFAAPCPSFPVDLNLLVERSDAGAFIVGGLANTWEAIFDGLQNQFEGSRFGLSSFIDTPISPAGSSFDYVYQQHFSLLRTDDSYRPFIRQQIEKLTTLGGLDEKNGQLAALVKLATNNDNAAPPRYGFAMRVAVIVTNSPYHIKGEEPSATAPAYPTVAAAGATLLKAGIFPVFIVGRDSIYNTYNNLVKQWGFGLVKKIDEQFSNLGAAVLAAIDAAEASAYVVGDPSDDRVIVTKPYTYTDITDGTTVNLPVNLGLNFKRQPVQFFETRFKLYVAAWGTVEVVAGKADKPVPKPQQEFIVMEDEPEIFKKVITLELSAFYTDSIESVITVIPDKGALYQVSGSLRDPVKGEQITTAGTVVTDKFRRVIFESPQDANGSPYTQFSWTATDDCDASGSGVVIIIVTAVEDNPRTTCVADEKVVNIDEDTPVVITLDGVDPDNTDGVVTAKISALPTEGQLFQFDASAAQNKGAQITSVNAVVTDAQHRVVYLPAKDSNRDASFAYVSSKLSLKGKTLLSTPCRVLITINPINDPPVPFVEPPTTWGTEDTDLEVIVGCYDVDVEETEIRIVRLTDNGTLHDTNEAGTKLATIAVNAFIQYTEYRGDGYTYAYVIYDPTSESDYGNPFDSFDFDCRDPQQVFSPDDETAIIALEFRNDLPITNEPVPQVVTTPEDTRITITLSGTDEEDGAGVVPHISTVPEKGTLYQFDGVTPIPDQAEPVRVEDPQGRVIYLPPQDEFQVGSPYTFFDFVVVDSLGATSPEREVPVFVTPVNDQPIATGGGEYVTNEDTPILIPLPGSDDYFGETPASELISIITDLPVGGTLYVGEKFEDAVEVQVGQPLPRQDVWYLPFPNQNGEDYDTFWYQVWDTNTTENLGYSEKVKITIDVNPVNDVPVPQSDNGIGCEDFDITVCVGGVDPDIITNADTISAVLTVLPQRGQAFQLNADGSRGEEILTAPTTLTNKGNPDNADGDYHEAGCFLFVPHPNEFALVYASFEYIVVDSAKAESAPLVITIDVLPVNDPPNAAGSDVTGNEDEEVLIDTLRGYDDPAENHTIKGVITKLPTNGNLFQSDRTPITAPNTEITDPDLKVIYHPNPDLFGTPLDSISFYVEDIPPPGFEVKNPPPQCAEVTSMKSDEITININILSKPDAPLVTSIDEYDTCENTTVEITITATDPENDPLSLFIMTEPDTGVILIGDTEVTSYPVQIGDVQEGTGSWTFTYWPKNDAAETATEDNNGLFNIHYKIYDGVESTLDNIIMDVKQAVYTQHTLKVNVIPSNDPPYILLNGTNADLNDQISILSDVAEYNLRTAKVVDIDSDQNRISLKITADKGVLEFRSGDQLSGGDINYENVIIDNSGPAVETTDGGRTLIFNATVYEINEFLQNTWWKSDDKDNDVTIVFTSDDFGRTGDARCDDNETVTTDTKTIFLTYESVSGDFPIAAVAGSSAALAAGVFLAGAGVAAAYKVLRATKVVQGVDAVKFDDGLFSNTVDNPLYAQNGAQSSNIYEGAL